MLDKQEQLITMNASNTIETIEYNSNACSKCGEEHFVFTDGHALLYMCLAFLLALALTFLKKLKWRKS